MMPSEVQDATVDFYKFWIDRWQSYTSNYNAVDLIATLVSQSARAFVMALECQEMLKDVQTHSKESIDKLASAAEEMKKIDTEAKDLRTQQVKDMAKLDFASAEIEVLKREVHESQCQVASLTKKVGI